MAQVVCKDRNENKEKIVFNKLKEPHFPEL